MVSQDIKIIKQLDARIERFFDELKRKRNKAKLQNTINLLLSQKDFLKKTIVVLENTCSDYNLNKKTLRKNLDSLKLKKIDTELPFLIYFFSLLREHFPFFLDDFASGKLSKTYENITKGKNKERLQAIEDIIGLLGERKKEMENLRAFIGFIKLGLFSEKTLDRIRFSLLEGKEINFYLLFKIMESVDKKRFTKILENYLVLPRNSLLAFIYLSLKKGGKLSLGLLKRDFARLLFRAYTAYKDLETGLTREDVVRMVKANKEIENRIKNISGLENLGASMSLILNRKRITERNLDFFLDLSESYIKKFLQKKA